MSPSALPVTPLLNLYSNFVCRVCGSSSERRSVKKVKWVNHNRPRKRVGHEPNLLNPTPQVLHSEHYCWRRLTWQVKCQRYEATGTYSKMRERGAQLAHAHQFQGMKWIGFLEIKGHETEIKRKRKVGVQPTSRFPSNISHSAIHFQSTSLLQIPRCVKLETILRNALMCASDCIFTFSIMRFIRLGWLKYSGSCNPVVRKTKWRSKGQYAHFFPQPPVSSRPLSLHPLLAVQTMEKHRAQWTLEISRCIRV